MTSTKLENASYMIMGLAAVLVAFGAGLTWGLTWASLGLLAGRTVAYRAQTAENKAQYAQNKALVAQNKALVAQNKALAAEGAVLARRLRAATVGLRGLVDELMTKVSKNGSVRVLDATSMVQQAFATALDERFSTTIPDTETD